MAKNNHKLKHFSFIDNIYGIKFHIYIGDLEEYIKKASKQHNLDTSNLYNVLGASYLDEDKNICVIWLNRLQNGIIDMEYLAHETLHATFDVLTLRGMKLSDESQEAFTYYQQYLISVILHKNLS